MLPRQAGERLGWPSGKREHHLARDQARSERTGPTRPRKTAAPIDRCALRTAGAQKCRKRSVDSTDAFVSTSPSQARAERVSAWAAGAESASANYWITSP